MLEKVKINTSHFLCHFSFRFITQFENLEINTNEMPPKSCFEGLF